MLRRPLEIGTLRIPHRVWLAPLAGVTDIPFRRICQEAGASLTYVEMLSATAIAYRARRTMDMMARDPAEPALGVQLTGSDAEEVGRAMEVLRDRPFDLFDLNMGCPVRKVVAKGWGAALLQQAGRVGQMVTRLRAETDRPISVKVRLGFSRSQLNIEENAREIAAGGADVLTIHGRTREDGYQAPVDYAGIRSGIAAARAAANRPIVLVGNGDVFGRASASRMVAETGCDGVMVSRGALGNPWVFRDILGLGPPQPTLEEWVEVVFRHLDYHQGHYPDARLAAVLFRKHLLWYLTGFPGVKRMRVQGSVIQSLDEARVLIRRFAAGLPADLPRQPGGTNEDPKRQMNRTVDRGVGAGVEKANVEGGERER
jgi:nifR3 family TIM-barrel protein